MGSNRGSAAIEMALVLPVLLIVFLAIVEFGNLMFVRMAVTNAAMMGARAGITALSESEAESKAASAVAEALPDSMETAEAEISFLSSPNRIQVAVSYTYSPIVGDALFGLLKATPPDTWTLSDTAVMSFDN